VNDDDVDLEPDDDGGALSPYEMAAKFAFGVIYMAAISYASYAAVKHADMIEIRLRGLRDRARTQWAQARAWRSSRNRMLFEAHYITREAAAKW